MNPPKESPAGHGLDGRVALVTGGGRGIGRAVALRLAREGARVAIWGRQRAPLEAVAAEIEGLSRKAAAIVCDVADPGQVGLAMERTRRELGPVEVLVANAGIAPSAPIQKTTLAMFREVLDVNLVGAFLSLQAVLPEMVERRWGRIVTVASTAAKVGVPYTAAYCASKHGLLGLTRAAALDVADKGVTVNAVCPSWVETDMVARAVTRISKATGKPEENAREALRRMNPQGRFLSPEEVADVVVFLCGPGASGINGQAWSVDGGEVTA
ncbi:MAG: SDR family NAD(P)-dependent oxidoreductase [Myxococcales bacterium]